MNMIERLRQEKEKMSGKGFSNNGFFQLPKTDEAEVRIRLLPAKNYFNPDGSLNPEPNLFYKRFGVHWINGKRIVCPKHTKGDACPICESVNELYNSKNDQDKEIAKEFKVQKRVWVNLIEVNPDGKYSNEPKVFEFGTKLLNNILDWCTDDDYYDLSDPDRGYDFRIIKQKVDGFPNYSASKPVKTSTKIPKDVLKALLDKALDIHTAIDKQVKTYDEIKAMFDMSGSVEPQGEDVEDVEDIDHDELLSKINARLGNDDD